MEDFILTNWILIIAIIIIGIVLLKIKRLISKLIGIGFMLFSIIRFLLFIKGL